MDKLGSMTNQTGPLQCWTRGLPGPVSCSPRQPSKCPQWEAHRQDRKEIAAFGSLLLEFKDSLPLYRRFHSHLGLFTTEVRLTLVRMATLVFLKSFQNLPSPFLEISCSSVEDRKVTSVVRKSRNTSISGLCKKPTVPLAGVSPGGSDSSHHMDPLR